MKEKHMDIQLKQNEIEAAVRRYVAETIGVNLTGKRLGVQFSMTRGAGGLIANLSIEDSSDVQIPGYTDRNADPVITTQELPKATVTTLELRTADAKPNTIGAAIAGATTEDKPAAPAEAVVEAAPEVAAEVVEEVVETPVKESSGLFNDD